MTDTRYKLIYQPADASKPIALVNPSPNSTKTLAEIAERCVPNGLKYKIIDTEDDAIKGILADRDFRNAWTADFSTYDGTGKGDI